MFNAKFYSYLKLWAQQKMIWWYPDKDMILTWYFYIYDPLSVSYQWWWCWETPVWVFDVLPAFDFSNTVLFTIIPIVLLIQFRVYTLFFVTAMDVDVSIQPPECVTGSLSIGEIKSLLQSSCCIWIRLFHNYWGTWNSTILHIPSLGPRRLSHGVPILTTNV